MILVSHYGLYIEYKHIIDLNDNERYTAEVLMKNDLSDQSSSNQVILIFFWFIFILFLVFAAYTNYQLKLQRRDREDTMFYKIYKSIVAIDKEFLSDKNQFQKQVVIEQIHDELKQVFNQDQLQEAVVKSKQALCDELS